MLKSNSVWAHFCPTNKCPTNTKYTKMSDKIFMLVENVRQNTGYIIMRKDARLDIRLPTQLLSDIYKAASKRGMKHTVYIETVLTIAVLHDMIFPFDATQVPPHVAEWSLDDGFPPEVLAEMRRLFGKT